MKLLKYMAGAVALLLFFVFLDSSGVGVRQHLAAVREWANGNTEKLRFCTVWSKNQTTKEKDTWN